MYALAFQSLYRSCQRRSNKLCKLEAALTWHMARGVIQARRGLLQVGSLPAHAWDAAAWLRSAPPFLPPAAGRFGQICTRHAR